MPSFDITPITLQETIQSLITANHPDLVEGNVTVDTIFAFDDKGGFPVKTNGYPSSANIKVSNLKGRVKGATLEDPWKPNSPEKPDWELDPQ